MGNKHIDRWRAKKSSSDAKTDAPKTSGTAPKGKREQATPATAPAAPTTPTPEPELVPPATAPAAAPVPEKPQPRASRSEK